MKSLEHILEQLSLGKISSDEAAQHIRAMQSKTLGHTQVDLDRLSRTGCPEVIYGAGKSANQIIEIAETLLEHQQNVLITRIKEESIIPVLEKFPQANYVKTASLIRIEPYERTFRKTSIAVVSAGTSDQAVAEEAAHTAEFLGNKVTRFYDCGVAGLHRLINKLPEIREARVIIAVAGMEGALPSVLAGLVKAPVIAVPTSVGYGTHFGGITTLLAMLTSCANGISVVNIDNGFGAGFNAHLINNL